MVGGVGALEIALSGLDYGELLVLGGHSALEVARGVKVVAS
jgi:hypothetical protein